MRTPRSSSRPASAPDAGVATPSAMLGSGTGIDRGVHMRGWRRGAGAGLAVVVLAAGLSAMATVAAPGAGAVNSTSCPLTALKKAGTPVEITMWHSMPRANGETLQKLTDAFNSSQSDVKVNLVNQIDYVQTFNKYKAGLSSGDLPDIVQLQESDQQQMIDTQTVLPASVCAKADKYSFSDFLPRVISYFTVQGTQYAMPFNTSGPVLYYNKKAFTAAGLDPNNPPKTLDDVRAAAEKLKANGVSAPLGLKTEPGYFEHWRALANKTYVNNSNGRKARATKTVYDDATGRQIFTWLSGMVKDGLATTNPDTGTGVFDNLLGIQSGSHAMAFETSAALGTISSVLAGGNVPNVELGVAPFPAPTSTAKGGVSVSGGELFIVNKSSPAKQAAAWKFLKFLDQPDSLTTWAIGTGYLPIRKAAADSAAMQQYWAQNPSYKVAYDQLASGPVNVATSGSVIGNYTGARDALRDAENSMFLEGQDPKSALKEASSNATTAIDDYNAKIGG
jgi:sn-glycerol 3-phosphate transport system substrate-binding protein